MVQTADHSSLGPVRMIGPAVKFSESANQVSSAPPVLNEHAQHVLVDVLGYNETTIRDLTGKGAFNE
jgi:succinate--hydroxymethylglutarate CoA-transferase